MRGHRPDVGLQAVEIEHQRRRRQRVAGSGTPISASFGPRFAPSLVTHPPPALTSREYGAAIARHQHRGRAHAAPAGRAGRPAVERGRDARRGGRPRPAGGEPADLQTYADEHGIALWPHTKTHKSPEIGLRQLELGAGGLTVAKTGEAEVFHEAGAPRILVHYPPFGADKWERLARLAADGRRADGRGRQRRARRGPVGGACAARRAARAARRARRRPAPDGPDDGGGRARELGAGLVRAAGGRGGGHQLLPGPLPRRRGDDPRAAGGGRRVPARDARRVRRRRACACDRISGGSTPTRYLTHETCVNELRSGTYALLDRNEYEPDGGRDACALWVEVTVISDRGARADRGRRRLQDADLGRAPRRRPRRDLRTARTRDLHTINEEHGYVDVVAA